MPPLGKKNLRAGSLRGLPGGVHINCYAAGDIVSRKTTTDVGGNANDSALLKNVSGKTKAELGSDYFAHWAKSKN